MTRSDVPVDMLFETFLKVLADVHANRYDWKVYVQVVNDLGKVIRATASKEQRMLLINGSKAKNLIGLQELSAFVKLKVRFGFANDGRNWRVRETVLVVVLDLAESGRLTEEEEDSLRAILFARRYVKDSEPEPVQRLFRSEAARNLMMKSLPDTGQRKVADLVGQYSTNVGNALAEAVEEEKNSDAEEKSAETSCHPWPWRRRRWAIIRKQSSISRSGRMRC